MMLTAILLIFNTNKGLRRLENKFLDDLYKETFILSILFGCIPLPAILYIYNQESIIANIFLSIITVCIWLLISTTLAFIIYKIAYFLKSKIKYEEVFSLLTFSFLPIILQHLIRSFLTTPNLRPLEFNTVHFRNIIGSLAWFISLRILYKGIKRYSQTPPTKTLLIMTPILLFFGVFHLIDLIKYIYIVLK